MTPRGPAARDRGRHVTRGVRGTMTCARVGAVRPQPCRLVVLDIGARLRAGRSAAARRTRAPRAGVTPRAGQGRSGTLVSRDAVRSSRTPVATIRSTGATRRGRRNGGWRGHIGARGVGAATAAAGGGASSVRRVPPGGRSRSPSRCTSPPPSPCTTGCSRSSPPPRRAGPPATPTSSSGGSAGCRGRSRTARPALHHLPARPLGVNGMWNTPVPVLAALFSPVTLTAGPVAAYNVAMILGPVVSGLALALALGRGSNAGGRAPPPGCSTGSPRSSSRTAPSGTSTWCGRCCRRPCCGCCTHCSSRPRPGRGGPVCSSGWRSSCRPGSTRRRWRCAPSCSSSLALMLAVRWPREARAPGAGRAAGGRGLPGHLRRAVRIPAVPAARRGRAGRARRSAGPRRRTPTRRTCWSPRRLTRFRTGIDPLAEKLHTHSGEQGGYVGVALLAVVVVAVLTARRPLTRVVAVVGRGRLGALARGEPRGARPRHRRRAALASVRGRPAGRGDRDDAVPGGGRAVRRDRRRAVAATRSPTRRPVADGRSRWSRRASRC